MRLPVLYVFLVLVGLFCASCQTTRTSTVTDTTSGEERLAEAFGWHTNYTRGQEIIRELSALSPEQARQLKFNAYRGEDVAFMTADALPGIGDRATGEGFYLRLIYQKGKEPGPRPYMWSASMVRGTILQVLPENKIIVIEVHEEHIVSTG
jgi:hypothetical protein